jgi:hypothetical protein
MTHYYFVSYHYQSQTGETGFGHVRIEMDDPVSCYDHVEVMRSKIKEVANNKGVIILGWHELQEGRNPEEDRASEKLQEEKRKAFALVEDFAGIMLYQHDNGDYYAESTALNQLAERTNELLK